MQWYRCRTCRHSFQAARKPSRAQRGLFNDYVWGRQSITQLVERTGRSHVWVKKQLDAAPVTVHALTAQSLVVAADVTFWGRSYGVCVFRAPLLKQNLWWKEVAAETPLVYGEGLYALTKQNITITGAVIDGKRGVAGIFRGIPVQHCQFHQVKTITKYLTRRPKTEAARELRALALTLTTSTEVEFSEHLALWYERWQTFLDEKTETQNKRGWTYTHRRIRAAYRSLRTNLPWLFTYQKYPELNIPNTTNTLDGMFSQIKNRLAVHRGLRQDRRYKLISEILKTRKTA